MVGKCNTSALAQVRNRVTILYSVHFTGEIGRRNYKWHALFHSLQITTRLQLYREVKIVCWINRQSVLRFHYSYFASILFCNSALNVTWTCLISTQCILLTSFFYLKGCYLNAQTNEAFVSASNDLMWYLLMSMPVCKVVIKVVPQIKIEAARQISRSPPV